MFQFLSKVRVRKQNHWLYRNHVDIELIHSNLVNRQQDC